MPSPEQSDDTQKITLPSRESTPNPELLKMAEVLGETQGKLNLAEEQLKSTQDEMTKQKEHVVFVEKISLQDRQKLVDVKKDIAKLKSALAVVKEERDAVQVKRKKETYRRQQSSAALSELKKDHERLVSEAKKELGLDDCLRAVPLLSKNDIENLRKVLTKQMKDLNGSEPE